jgi:putative transposase
VDGRGIPLSIVVSAANRHDVRLLAPTLDGVIGTRPAHRHHLCADKGYTGQPAWSAMVHRGYRPHVPQRGETLPRQRHPQGRARRWVVERTPSWLNRFRKLLVRFEKLRVSRLALLELACALIVFRQVISIHG